MLTSWNDMLKSACRETGDTFENLIATISKEELDRTFDSGYGSPEGEAFVAWGESFVYFPITYDGAESVKYVPRNPREYKLKYHFGGY